MASINELPPDQVAVLRLLLTQGASYESIASSLRIEPREVRSRAAAALDSLATSSPPPADQRDETTDYLLGQQDAGQRARSRRMLASSPQALTWARSLADPLSELASSNLPELPEPSSSAPRVPEDDDGMVAVAGAGASTGAAAASGSASAGRPAGGQRRAGLALLAAAGAIVLVGAGFFVGRGTAPDTPTSSPGTTVAGGAGQPDGGARPLAAARLRPPPGSPAPKALGIAQFARQRGQTILGVAAQDMPKAPKGSGYGVWLEGGAGRPVWLGYFAAVNDRGQIGAQTPAPVNPASYKTLLITLETTRKPTAPGKTYLSGAIATASG